jgi:adenylate cyclase
MTGQLRSSRDALIGARDHTDSILQSLSNGVLTVDDQQHICDINQAATRILASTPAWLGRPVGRALPGDTWVDEALGEVVRSGAPQWRPEMTLQRDGDPISVNATAVPLRVHGQQRGAVLVLEDLTREKRIQATMRRYMTREVADRVLAEGGAALGGTLQPATVLFADIRGFTTLSESLGAQDTVALLNEFLSAMVAVILNRKGILDKYIGDGVMAVFGVPFVGEQDADNAVQAAVEMVRALRAFNEAREYQGGAPLQLGIGLNTDEVVAGNIGSPQRMDYTVIGDGVNLASRLEGATKYYGVDILVSESTIAATTRSFLTREIDSIRVKGKARSVAVHEVLDCLSEDERVRAEACLPAFAAGIKAYRAQRWLEATKHFNEADNIRGGDPPSRRLRERCQRFTKSPPNRDWDSVWIMTDK